MPDFITNPAVLIPVIAGVLILILLVAGYLKAPPTPHISSPAWASAAS